MVWPVYHFLMISLSSRNIPRYRQYCTCIRAVIMRRWLVEIAKLRVKHMASDVNIVFCPYHLHHYLRISHNCSHWMTESAKMQFDFRLQGLSDDTAVGSSVRVATCWRGSLTSLLFIDSAFSRHVCIHDCVRRHHQAVSRLKWSEIMKSSSMAMCRHVSTAI